MSTAPIISHIDRASFTLWSKDDIKKISVKKVTEPKSFEKAGAMHPDGLYSHALGSVKRFEVCTTCGLTDSDCPGHYGHIELSVPVYHPLLVQVMYQIISKCCLECFHFRLAQPSLKLFLAQLEALNYGFDHLVEELNEISADMCNDKSEGSKFVEGDMYLPVALAKKLNARIEAEKEKTPNFDCKKRPQQRNIVERLSKLFRNFINGQLIKPAKKCPHCGEKKISMSLHQQSVLVVGINSSKPLQDEIDIGADPKKIRKRKGKELNESISDGLNFIATDAKQFITPLGARAIFRKLMHNEKRTLERIFHFLNLDNSSQFKQEADEKTEDDDDPKKKKISQNDFQPIDLFFIDTILVPPSKFRPPMTQRGYSFEGPRTAALSNVMKQSVVVQELIDQLSSESDEIEAEKLLPKLQSNWKNLQTAVNCLYDNEMDKYGKNKYPGLKQLIDKKEGLFRKNMMGKRVNFAARSVISPDPNISVDQVGVPLVFAKKLTYPEPVTPWNIEKLRQAILNGPLKYPGAVSVVFEDDKTISLAKESTRQQIASRLNYKPRYFRSRNKREATHQCTIVNRHLVTGDVLLFNRQPTLHKASIMAFRARVLPNEKGFRLHYANCKSFNADFDGDEMNAHLPQGELARSEAYNIASVNYQYLVPKDGSPLSGLIQDHVVSACIMTKRDMFYDKERYDQLVFCSLGFLEKPIKLEKPAIIRPVHLWTGKQIMTTIIKNCIPEGKLPPTLNIKSKIGPKMMHVKPKDENLSDCHVIIRNGELHTGFIDKSNIGGTQYGLVHICYELYGGETSSNLMSAFARLATWYLQLYEGFTLGIADILIEDDVNEERRQSILESLTVGPDSAKEALGLTGEVAEETLENKLRDAHSDRNPLPMKKLDAAMKTRTDKIASKISSRCLPDGLIRRFPDNNLQMMIQSGAKGGTVNALQISCLLGQIELEGRRVPLSMSGRSLPSFKPYDTSPKAGGFVSGRFLTGIQPQEFFFHCMAGREGLIDTAVKTSRSGYLQRCLIKHLEGLTVQYDQTVRDSCGSVIQFLYGEDGLDIVKCQMLKEKAFPALIDNCKVIGANEDEMEKLIKAKEAYEADVIAITNSIQNWQENNGDDKTRKLRGSGFLDFLATKMLEYDPLAEPSQSQQIVEKDDSLTKSEEAMDFERIEKQVNQEQQYAESSLTKCYRRVFEAWYELSFKEKKRWNKTWESCPDPLIAMMNPASHFGVVPEKLDDIIGTFVQKNPQLIVNSASLLGADPNGGAQYIDCDVNPEISKSILDHCNQSARLDKPKLTKHEFYNLCYNLYMKMLAQPGEAVGLLAAQSIGEPSTQMTLNTFHFAGRGEMNVTLGIPRLREILMTASAKIGTPSMDLPLLKVMKDELGNELDADGVEDQAKRVKLALNAVRLSDVLEYVDITEKVINQRSNEAAANGREFRKRKGGKDVKEQRTTSKKGVQYELEFVLLSSKYYKHEFKTNSSKVMKFIEEVFVDQLVDSMVKRQKRLLRAEEMFDVSTKRMNKERAKSAKELQAENDLEERELDDYNAKAAAKEKAKEDDSSSEEEDEGEGDNTTQRLKNRRNADLDYEEPEDDDLDVGDVEATTAEVEEGDKEILADTDADALLVKAPEELLAKQQLERERANQLLQQQHKRSPVEGEQVEGEDGEEEYEDDGVSEKVKRELAVEQELEEKPAGKNIELAALEDVCCNTRSGFVTPTHEAANEEPPVKKSKMQRIDPSAIAEASKSKSKLLDGSTIEQRIAQVRMKPCVMDYSFDTKRERWCKLKVCIDLTTTRLDMGALIEAEARRTYVHRVGNIQRALIVKDVNAKSRGAKCDKMIKTEGVSLLSLVRFNHILDLNAIYSNDIHAIANTYGIEAAAQAIRREMASVFAVYGIEVDSRHLSLIADYMTYNGSIRGMNRMSMEASASPFQQMSYESTLRYLKWAAILGLYDDIKSPSASLVFGRPTRGGTGVFGLLSGSNELEAAPAAIAEQQAEEEEQW